MKKSYYVAIRISVFLVLLMALGILFGFHINRMTDNKGVVLDDRWTVTINGKESGNVSLSEFNVPKTDKGTHFLLKRTITEDDFEQASLRVMLRYCTLQVYIDGEEIYQHGISSYDNGDILGSGYVWVELPKNYMGKELTIEMVTGEKSSFRSIEPITIVKSAFGREWLFLNHFITAVVTSFLFSLGMIAILSTVVIGLMRDKSMILFWMGAFSLAISLWMLSNSRLIELLSDDFSVNVRMEYWSMYLACVCLAFFLGSFLREAKQKRAFWILGFIFLLISFVLGVLNDTNTIHFCKTVHFFQVFAALSIVLCVASLLKTIRKTNRKPERILLLGVVCFSISVILELARYSYNKNCLPIHQMPQSIVPVGALVFILAMVSAFVAIMMEKVAENLERATLYNMAYQDSLTSLKNRAWCEKIMQEYEQDKKPITIINMDLNLFKEVNDTYGHATGDELLVRFGKILLRNFRETDCVGRMGGDEFIVIMDYAPDYVIYKAIRRMMEDIEEENKESSKEYQLSVSVGFSSNFGKPGLSAWKVYEEADRRMYEEKQETKRKDSH